MEKRCIIVSGGRPGPAPQPQPGDFVIACDRGYRYCAGLGLQPDLFIGDFDSYDGAVDPAVPVERLQPEKDDTDTGHAIRHALDQGCRNFIIGIGGSATNDGGTGMLHALGCHFRKADGTDIAPGACELSELASIDCSELDPRLAESYFAIACDVTNLLCGPQGASFIFAPQKGADPDMVLKLDAALWHLADISAKALGKDFRDQPGAGAAGGLGFAFAAYLHGCLRPGVDIVLDAVLPEEQLQDADIVVTGEGRFDGQTAMGKAPVGIARRAKAHGCKVFVLAGSVEPEGAHTLQKDRPLVDGVFSILPGVLSLEDAMREETAYENMRFTAEQVFRIVAGR